MKFMFGACWMTAYKESKHSNQGLLVPRLPFSKCGCPPPQLTWEFLRSAHSRASPDLLGVGPSILWSHKPPKWWWHTLQLRTTQLETSQSFTDLTKVNQLLRGRSRTNQKPRLLPPCLCNDAREVIRRHGWPLLVAFFIPEECQHLPSLDPPFRPHPTLIFPPPFSQGSRWTSWQASSLLPQTLCSLLLSFS